jgi:hypothetical protein
MRWRGFLPPGQDSSPHEVTDGNDYHRANSHEKHGGRNAQQRTMGKLLRVGMSVVRPVPNLKPSVARVSDQSTIAGERQEAESSHEVYLSGFNEAPVLRSDHSACPATRNYILIIPSSLSNQRGPLHIFGPFRAQPSDLSLSTALITEWFNTPALFVSLVCFVGNKPPGRGRPGSKWQSGYSSDFFALDFFVAEDCLALSHT